VSKRRTRRFSILPHAALTVFFTGETDSESVVFLSTESLRKVAELQRLIAKE
jgi:hypothetical protein